MERRSETVTFLFTDIEGSSRLWEEQPAEMGRLLATHDQIIRSVVSERDGEVFATGGDSFAVAFGSSDSAVSAALAAQRRLIEELGGELRVRVAVHTGVVERRGDGYLGAVLNRTARLRDAAYGGQILVTAAVYGQVDVEQMPGVSFVDLGDHRLRDLAAPERVYQVTAPGLPSDFPPIRSLGAFVHNLPTQLTSFFGRTTELTLIDKLLADTRHATLVGPGGSGKTRLALQAAAETLHLFDDGAWFVDLRDIDDPDDLGPRVASTLRVVLAGERAVADQVVDALWARNVLLILDNCEHLLEAVAPLVEKLLRREGTVRVLTTSREPLGLPGESTVTVGPLPLPAEPDLQQLQDHEAAQLFVERARHARPGFVLDQHTEAVFEICRAVEGLPLALELAAARLRAVSPEEVAARLDDQLSVLRTTVRAGDLRHATIEATIAWSWEHLTPSEQALFARLSVFRGTWSLEATEAICGFDPIDRTQILDLLCSLVDKSLVVPQDTIRYRLLEPLRQYAARQLDDQATQQLQQRLIDYWTTTLTGSHKTVLGSQHAALNGPAKTLELDQTNLTAAVEWALDSGRYQDAMTIFASPFGDLLYLRGSAFETASLWMDLALQHRQQISSEVLLGALGHAAAICAYSWRNEAWLEYSKAGIEISRTPQERQSFELPAALATGRLGWHEEANAILERIVSESDDPSMRASALLGQALFEAPERAWQLSQQAMDLSPVGAHGWWDEPNAAAIVGIAARDVGEYDLAVEMLERSLDVGRQWGYSEYGSFAAAKLAQVHVAKGRLDKASAIIEEALPVVRRLMGPNVNTSRVLHMAADIARLQGDLQKAHQYNDEAQRATVCNHEPIMGLWVTCQEALIARDEENLDQARKLLDGIVRRAEELDREDLLVWIRAPQASVELRSGQPDRALKHLGEALAQSEHLTHLETLEAVDLTAIGWAQQGKPQQAARLLSAVDQERQKSGLVIQPPDRPNRDEAVRHTRAVLGDDWEAQVGQGRSMTLDQAVDYARSHLAA